MLGFLVKLHVLESGPSKGQVANVLSKWPISANYGSADPFLGLKWPLNLSFLASFSNHIR